MNGLAIDTERNVLLPELIPAAYRGLEHIWKKKQTNKGLDLNSNQDNTQPRFAKIWFILSKCKFF